MPTTTNECPDCGADATPGRLCSICINETVDATEPEHECPDCGRTSKHYGLCHQCAEVDREANPDREEYLESLDPECIFCGAYPNYDGDTCRDCQVDYDNAMYGQND